METSFPKNVKVVVFTAGVNDLSEGRQESSSGIDSARSADKKWNMHFISLLNSCRLHFEASAPPPLGRGVSPGCSFSLKGKVDR